MQILSSTIISDDVTYYAHWTPNVYTIRFHANSGTDATVDQSFTYGDTVTLRKNTFTRSGYGFTGWALDPDGEAVYADGKTLTDVAAIQDDVIHLYAVWVNNRYAVRFDSHGGVGRMENQTLERGVAALLNACTFTRTGYEFAGWAVSTTGDVVYGDGESVVNVYEQTGSDIVLYAVWTPIEYSVSYDANGGAGTMDDQPMTYDQEAQLSAGRFTRPDSFFRGWANAPSGAVAYSDGATVKNLSAVADSVVKLYAVWQEKPASVIVCETVFDGLGVVSMDDDGNAVVTLTNDVNGTVEMLDNSGNVTIDLNGHDLIGGDGQPAIAIVPGDDDGEPTMLTVLTGVDDATVQGGEGAPAIEVQDGAQGGVLVSIGEGVTVQGGGDDVPAVVGDVGENEGTIVKATYDMSDARWNASSFVYDGTEKTVTVEGLPAGVSVASYSGNTASGPGTYTAHATLAYDTENYNAPMVADLEWTIKSIEEAALEEIFENLPATITSDGEGGWIVTLTNDVDSADLPIDIPDNLGPVTIDLGGHDLVGCDGQPAIRIVPGDGDGQGGATRLSIEDTSDGEKGQVIGDGDAVGIEIAEDAASGVRLDVDEGVSVLNGDGSEQEFKPKLVGTGTVTVPKSWKVGQKVTWKAVAAKGSVFAHWEGAFVDSRMLSKNELRNPSLAFPVPPGFDTNGIRAVFIAVDDDRLGSLALSQSGPLEPNADVAGLELVDDSESYVTASVSGLPTGLKFDAKTLRITGAPTKSGVYWVQIKAKNASGYQWAENVKVTVSGGGKEAKEPKLARTPYYPLTVLSTNAAAGTMTGTGVYAEGKKVTIKATAAKGFVFAGWYEDSRLTTPATFEKGDFRTASQNVVVPETRYVFARFVTAEEDKAGVSLAVDGTEMRRVDDAALCRTNVMCGVYMEWPVAVEALSLPTVAVSGLPSGLKFTAKDVVDSKTKQVTVPANTIYGTPTAASKVDAKTGVVKPSVVKVTVTTAGKSKVAYEIDVTVDAVNEWAVGTFDGAVFSTGETPVVPGDAQQRVPPAGLVQAFTVSAAGKISGKLLEGGKTWTLSAANFDAYDAEAGVYTATVVGKSGKEAVTNVVTIAAEEAAVAGRPPYRRGVVTGGPQSSAAEWTAWQNLWKTEPWKTDAKPFAKAPALTLHVVEGELVAATSEALPSGTISLKFASSGAVTASGKFVTGQDAKGKDVVYSANCSSVLIPAGTRDACPYRVYLYFPPKAGKFDGYAAEISLVWDGAAFSLAE